LQSSGKHGHSNFELTILEYCEVSDLLIREKHSWGIFKPEYNIAQDPTAPMSGRKHSDKTKTIMSEGKKGENHPNYGKQKFEGAGRPSQQIEVTDVKNNNKTSYNSMGEAAKALNLISYKAISDYFRQNQKKPYKGQYIFKKI